MWDLGLQRQLIDTKVDIWVSINALILLPYAPLHFLSPTHTCACPTSGVGMKGCREPTRAWVVAGFSKALVGKVTPGLAPGAVNMIAYWCASCGVVFRH
jgi:hypothetical protein